MTYPAVPELLYLTDVSLLAGGILSEAAYAAVPAYRREKTDRLRMPADKMLSLGVGLLLRRAMRDCGVPEDAVPGVSGNEKPVFPAYPAFRFNLSHAGTLAVCAVSPRDIGCDIERIRPDSLKIAKRFFLPQEYDYISSFRTDAEREQMFFRFWTMKEAFMKATGQGMKLPPDAFEIVSSDGVGRAGVQTPRTFTVRQNFDSRLYYFSEPGTVPGYCLSVCTEAAPFRAAPRLFSVAELLQDEVPG